jgi:hypothetical protein
MRFQWEKPGQKLMIKKPDTYRKTLVLSSTFKLMETLLSADKVQLMKVLPSATYPSSHVVVQSI